MLQQMTTMRVHVTTINVLVCIIYATLRTTLVDSAACSKLEVKACDGTHMESYASGTFIPFNGDCEASPTYSKYKKKNGDPVYIFYKPSSAKWYISYTGSFSSTCQTNLYDIHAAIFDAADEPYKETGDDDGEAKCYNGLDNNTNRQGFDWQPISIKCIKGNNSGIGGNDSGAAINKMYSAIFFTIIAAGFIL